MTGIDERPLGGRFGAATPGARAAPPLLEELLASRQARRGRRLTWRRALAAAGIAALAAGGLAAGRYAWPASSPPRVQELVVTSVALPAGTRLTGPDLRVAVVRPGAAGPSGGLSPAAAARLIGLVTSSALPAGTFLQRSFLAPSGAIPDPAQALVGLALKPGQLPSGGLAVGEQVRVVALPTTPQGSAVNPVSLVTTTVWYLQGPDSSGTTLATVVVPAALATRLAGYAAQGEVALVATDSAAPAGAAPAGAAPAAATPAAATPKTAAANTAGRRPKTTTSRSAAGH